MRTTFRAELAKLIQLACVGVWPTPYWLIRGWLEGLHEPEMSLVPLLCDAGELALDVGANLGLYTHLMLRNAGWVHAFEPVPGLARVLARGYQRRGRLTIHELALSDREAMVSMRVPASRAWLSYGTIEPANVLEGKLDVSAGVRELAVRTRCLDAFAFSGVGLVKIDVEGHEQEVLHGGRQLIERDLPALIVECDERHRPGCVGAVRGWLEQRGYRGFFMWEGRLVDVGSFELSQHQRPGRKPFINNFTFAQGHRLERLAPLLGRPPLRLSLA